MTPFLFSVATHLLLLPPLAASTAVLDIDDHPLQAKTNYYALPLFGNRVGLTMLPQNDTLSCPLHVAQENHEGSLGLPIKFYPVDPKQREVPESTDLNFVFDAATTCVQSTVWRLTLDDSTGRRYVATAGQVGNPGIATVSNWFKIEKAGAGTYVYKIVFCPGVCSFCRVFCGDIGVFFEDGKRWLGFRNEQPLWVMFKKA